MTEQLKEIGARLKGLRMAVEVGEADFCAQTGVTAEELAAYEQGNRDFSFSFLYNAARVLGVDVMDLMSGDSPRLSSCSLVKSGKGYQVDRRAAYRYSHLAFTFRNKLAEPFLVTVEPKDETPVLHAHGGQEFNYMVSGTMRFYIGSLIYEIRQGDSLYFDASQPHGMQAVGAEPAQFLAVVIGS